MRKLLSVLALLAVLVVTACSPASSSEQVTTVSGDSAVLDRLGFAELTGQQIVEAVDKDPGARPLAFTASVRPGGVMLADDQGEVTVPLPADQFYVSVAPYVTRTHPCHFHSLATCNGELKGVDIAVKITATDGTVLVDEQTTTHTGNGFVGYWLPRGQTGTVQVTTADGKSGSAPFSAVTDEDATCMTTLQVA